jgi:hypothetical protein
MSARKKKNIKDTQQDLYHCLVYTTLWSVEKVYSWTFLYIRAHPFGISLTEECFDYIYVPVLISETYILINLIANWGNLKSEIFHIQSCVLLILVTLYWQQ